MDKPVFIMMCGLVASGKSYKAKELAKDYDATIFSSDDLREELFGDVNNQEHNQEVFTELHRRIKECLRNGKSAIYDACNISYKRRMGFIQELKNIPCEKICVLMATPYEKCIERNKLRERKVSEDIIKRMYMNFWVPAWFEGWDDIQVKYCENSIGYYGTVKDFLNNYKNYDQHNSHHKCTLSDHCKLAYDYLINENNILKYAALMHDCAKPEAATFINKKNEVTKECHYYNHQNMAGLKSLFYRYENVHPLDVAILCCWHMQLYFIKEEKTLNKYKNIWGQDLYENLLKLHEADINAH